MTANVYAVVDTNVLVSALLARHSDSAPVQIFESLLEQRFIPLYNDEILAEYYEVFRRPKFSFDEEAIGNMLDAIVKFGLCTDRAECSYVFPDPKDVVFYEVALSVEDSYLVTGNVKHFPADPIVVSPAEMLDILNRP